MVCHSVLRAGLQQGTYYTEYHEMKIKQIQQNIATSGVHLNFGKNK